jgi:FKBP-type peptidyl-prolyl cis-trans isomerase
LFAQAGTSPFILLNNSYAYGKYGLGEILPANSDAVLEFEMLGINENKLS